MELATIGYEGKKADEFFEKLGENGIEVVLDVRKNAFSMRPEFSRGFGKLVEKNGFEYQWLPEFGVPKEVRDRLKQDGDYEGFFHEYAQMLKEKSSLLKGIAPLIYSKKCCLVCFEADAGKCHRSRLADGIRKANGNGLKIRHL